MLGSLAFYADTCIENYTAVDKQLSYFKKDFHTLR
jgi:hypothetical protein